MKPEVKVVAKRLPAPAPKDASPEIVTAMREAMIEQLGIDCSADAARMIWARAVAAVRET